MLHIRFCQTLWMTGVPCWAIAEHRFSFNTSFVMCDDTCISYAVHKVIKSFFTKFWKQALPVSNIRDLSFKWELLFLSDLSAYMFFIESVLIPGPFCLISTRFCNLSVLFLSKSLNSFFLNSLSAILQNLSTRSMNSSFKHSSASSLDILTIDSAISNQNTGFSNLQTNLCLSRVCYEYN